MQTREPMASCSDPRAERALLRTRVSRHNYGRCRPTVVLNFSSPMQNKHVLELAMTNAHAYALGTL